MFDIAGRLKAYQTYRKTRDELARLSNRELADIGIARGNIEHVARGHRV